jgi:hypothetical protein
VYVCVCVCVCGALVRNKEHFCVMSRNLKTLFTSGEFMLKYSRLNVKIMQTVNLIQCKISVVVCTILIKGEAYPYENIILLFLSLVYLL